LTKEASLCSNAISDEAMETFVRKTAKLTNDRVDCDEVATSEVGDMLIVGITEV
jgi:hypothetical protein